VIAHPGGPVLPPSVRAKIEFWRDRVRTGVDVTCGGVSMEPAIRRGQAVRVVDRAPRRGEVAAFITRRGVLELHRLIARAPGTAWWVHAGDNQASRRLGLVHRDQIVGTAVTPRAAIDARLLARAALRVASAATRRVRDRGRS
jgi:hypothetical protein